MNRAALRVSGPVIAQGDAGFEAACATLLWNRLRPERRPEVIVRATSADDVVAAVRFARAEGLRVAVRSGGHSWCGAPLRDGGLLLDLGALDAVEIDGRRRVARVGPAVQGGAFARRLAAGGLCFPIGHCPTVALGGYLLGGGLGWNSGAWGPACASIAGIDVVTAAGELLHADARHDLLWAARGGGLGFPGIVTRFHLALQPLPRAITSVTVVHALHDAAEVIETLADATLPRELEVVAILGQAPPPAAAHCRDAGGRACIVGATVFADDATHASDVLRRLLHGRVGTGCLLRDEPQGSPLEVLGDATAAAFPTWHRYLAETAWIDAPPRDVVPILATRVRDAPSPRSQVLCAIPQASDAFDGAWSMSARMLALAYAVWDDPADDDANRAWHRELVAALDPLTVGRYAGESDLAWRPAQAEASFSPSSWLRLEAIRRRWDPDGTLHGWF
ncbi:MAG: FAD-binding oxidoreductase [bacterium]|nr:FAD-binding oxidoreductase [bacterium]